jgi:hypothetical protein
MKKFTLTAGLLLLTFFTWSQTPKIKAYFTRPVNTAVSTGVNAVCLDNLVDDTLIAYINRAKYSIDAAIYSFNETSAITSISAAINNAYARGVAIRWIYDGSSSNPSLPLLNSNIHILASPTSALYGIMHNKFMVIDAGSQNLNEPTVWTGSCNWTSTQINTDANNVIIIQDKDVANAYTTEFNEMWGGTGLVPNSAGSKFGPYKTNNTTHTFNVGGTIVEVYFSPSDGTNAKLQHAIGSADADMYFGIYSFTVAADADSIVDRIQNGVYTAGIMDPTSSSYQPYAILVPVMGSNLIKDNITGLYHNKMLIVDPAAPDSDPLVFTGSHNWSSSADTRNDENSVIVHNATVANVYYQSFYQNFTDEGGTLVNHTGIESATKHSLISVYPNPCSNVATVKLLNGVDNKPAFIAITDATGREIQRCIFSNGDSYRIDTRNLSEGLYFIRVQTPDAVEIRKLQVIR